MAGTRRQLRRGVGLVTACEEPQSSEQSLRNPQQTASETTHPQASSRRGEVLQFIFLQLFILGLRGPKTISFVGLRLCTPTALEDKGRSLGPCRTVKFRNRKFACLSQVQTKTKRSRKMKGRPCEPTGRGRGT